MRSTPDAKFNRIAKGLAIRLMVCMGIGMRCGRKTSAKDFAGCGIGLLLTGLILNIFRYVLPMLTAYALSGEKLYLNTFTFLFGADILEFAGLALRWRRS